jgi:hypothetical protein
LISGEEVLGSWSMCVTETEKFFPCGTIEATDARQSSSGRHPAIAGNLEEATLYVPMYLVSERKLCK